ncbi:beta-ketoacyl-ACP synthase III [Roseospirillum parvum]|uniref:Beta-ketoacyl-[acyl-carrier-protein] synthase III n=1 Tax=Roseospirillum parvum TaxID=83401 RepID=A0A1G7YC88_9PROT|nr:beta-ketoacyl-ACP synthase III [Roseospirillum parvum]SDG93943.1 3-oxoacyl-[acyl-carrier-protein] synthase-3 [Roseospirillum parvum]
MVPRSRMIGAGAYLPARVMTNDDLARQIETSDDWIRERTGIRQRHIAAEGETTADMAAAAARQALEQAGRKGEDVDLIIVATATPNHTFPATAVRVQAMLGATGPRAFAFDVHAVCSGFVYALAMADRFLVSGQARTALVIGAETFSRILNWEDRGTCVLFGDGAGAMLLEAGEGTGTPADRGVLTTHLHSDGRHHDLLYTDGGVSTTGTAGTVQMEGREVFRHAVVKLAEVAREALDSAGVAAGEVDWVVPHQANLRIIEGTTRKLGIPAERVVVTVDRHANTSAASIPLAFSEAVRDGRIQPGNLVLFEAMGGGFTWASALLRV